MPETISQDHFDKLVTALRTHDSVSDCLPYSGIAQVPAVLDHLAAEHEKAEGLEWDDVCPAYALAVITHGDYRLPSDDDPMQVLWNEVGGESRLVWHQVRDLVAEAWRWLDAVKSRSEMT